VVNVVGVLFRTLNAFARMGAWFVVVVVYLPYRNSGLSGIRNDDSILTKG
jgi:hypothetical protein